MLQLLKCMLLLLSPLILRLGEDLNFLVTFTNVGKVWKQSAVRFDDPTIWSHSGPGFRSILMDYRSVRGRVLDA